MCRVVLHWLLVNLVLFLAVAAAAPGPAQARQVTLSPSGQNGFSWSEATDINAAGRVVGWIATDGSGGLPRAVLWQDGVAVALGALTGDDRASRAYALNDADWGVGYAETADGGHHAVLWADGRTTDLGTLPGSDWSVAVGINDGGQVVGFSGTVDGGPHAVLWANGQIIDLGTLPGHRQSAAIAINDAGQVVGSSDATAVLWAGGYITDLGSLPGGTENRTLAINEGGQLVGWFHPADGGSIDKEISATVALPRLSAHRCQACRGEASTGTSTTTERSTSIMTRS